MHSSFQARHIQPGDRITLDGAEHLVTTVTSSADGSRTILHTDGGVAWSLAASKLVNARRDPQ